MGSITEECSCSCRPGRNDARNSEEKSGETRLLTRVGESSLLLLLVFKIVYLFILILVALGLCCCVQASLAASSRGYSSEMGGLLIGGLSCFGAQALGCLGSSGFGAGDAESSGARHCTCVPCAGRHTPKPLGRQGSPLNCILKLTHNSSTLGAR